MVLLELIVVLKVSTLFFQPLHQLVEVEVVVVEEVQQIQQVVDQAVVLQDTATVIQDVVALAQQVKATRAAAVKVNITQAVAVAQAAQADQDEVMEVHTVV